MSSRLVHFEVEVGLDCLFQPLCENNAGRDAIAAISPTPAEMTTDDAEVTCRKCLKALGYEAPAGAVPYSRMSIDLREDGGRIAA